MKNILKQLRVKAGLTQEKLAEELKIAPATIQNWESRDLLPPDQLKLLMDYYKYESNVRNNLVVALYGEGNFQNIDEILCNDKKDLCIVVLDMEKKWRNIMKYLSPEKACFYSLSDADMTSLCINPCKLPYGVNPGVWIKTIASTFSEIYGLSMEEKMSFFDILYQNYTKAGVLPEKGDTFLDEKVGLCEDWKLELSNRSKGVSFHHIANSNTSWSDSMQEDYKKIGKLLSCMNLPYTAEYRLYSKEDDFCNPNSSCLGKSMDSLFSEKEIVILEAGCTDSLFIQFVCQLIQAMVQKKLYNSSKEIIFVEDTGSDVKIISSLTGNMTDIDLEKLLKR